MAVCDKLRGANKQALIRRCPNGESRPKGQSKVVASEIDGTQCAYLHKASSDAGLFSWNKKDCVSSINSAYLNFSHQNLCYTYTIMLSLFIDYTKWHYSFAFINIFRLAREFARFFLNLFSVSLFLRTLFSPIFSIPVNDVDSVEASDMIAVFLGGVILRIVGAVIRFVVLVVGLFLSITSLVFFTIISMLWLSMPLVGIGLVYCLIVLSNSFL